MVYCCVFLQLINKILDNKPIVEEKDIFKDDEKKA